MGQTAGIDTHRIATVTHAGDGNLHSAVEAGESPAEAVLAEEALNEVTRLALELGGTKTEIQRSATDP